MEINNTNDLICMIISCPTDDVLTLIDNMSTDDISKQNKEIGLRTPLHVAVSVKKPHVVKKILEKLSDDQKNIKDAKGKTALDVAIETEQNEIIDMFKN